jgi:large subunit ribosomal protein L4
VSGGGAKPYRQKGTGRARQGTIRAPQYQGGGVVFGPVPRGYTQKLPKKMRRAALLSALSQRLGESALTIVDDLQLEGYKTKRVLEMLSALGLNLTSTLIVIDEPSVTIEASARNLPGVSVIRSEGVNVYDLLRHKSVLMTKAAVEKLQARLIASGAPRSAESGDGE